jgi:antitoxin ParD1/3/4
MTKPMNLNVRVGGALKDHLVARISDTGDYDNASEYVRDLIRRDKERVEFTTFEAKRAALQKAFASPDADYMQITMADIIRQATLPE